MATVTVTQLQNAVQDLLGVGTDGITSIHIQEGTITVVTQPHPLTGNKEAYDVLVVPDKRDHEFSLKDVDEDEFEDDDDFLEDI